MKRVVTGSLTLSPEETRDAILRGRPFSLDDFKNMSNYDPLEDWFDDALFDASFDFDYDPGVKAHFDAFMDHLITDMRNRNYEGDWKREARAYFDEHRRDYEFGIDEVDRDVRFK